MSSKCGCQTENDILFKSLTTFSVLTTNQIFNLIFSSIFSHPCRLGSSERLKDEWILPKYFFNFIYPPQVFEVYLFDENVLSKCLV